MFNFNIVFLIMEAVQHITTEDLQVEMINFLNIDSKKAKKSKKKGRESSEEEGGQMYLIEVQLDIEAKQTLI